MSDLPAPAATRLNAPRWLDGRLLAGVVLVLLSVVVGAKVIASADRYDTVWAASREVAAGTVLAKGDVQKVRVRFHDHGGGYFAATGGSLVGRTTTQPLAAGQLIPVAAAPVGVPAETRLVTVPVTKLHIPRGGDLRGVQVDVYVTVKNGISDSQVHPQLVLANVTIADTVNDSAALGASGNIGVVLSVPLGAVTAVVGAAQIGSIDLVRVPAANTLAQPSLAPFVTPPASPGT